MRASQYFLPTLKEVPADTETVSHQLMLRSGMIRKNATGIYSWLPLGLRVLKKIEDIIRAEMNKSGALELLMPAVLPAELWQETGRWDNFGPHLLKIRDRHEHEFCFGPTHEEVIVDLARRELRSYKQLPITFYQIQMKFRDEIRPRFGVMRAREFLMKDAYSFHLDEASLQKTYELMYSTYCNIFDRLGLKYRVVKADSGNIGGKVSHEFHVLAESGEDQIVYSDESDYAANMEVAECALPEVKRSAPAPEKMVEVDTPNQHTIVEVAEFLHLPSNRLLKTLIVVGKNSPLVALVLRGDHELNELKASRLEEVASPLMFANDEHIKEAIGCSIGSLGPVGLNVPIIIDRDAALCADFVCGANKDGKHLKNVNWERDLPLPKIADLRNVKIGDLSPDGKGKLKIARGIEVGHVFQLGDKYSKSMNAAVLGEDGKALTMTMGCYGIGVSRLVAAAIEQNNDVNGIIWPEAIAPFKVAILPINIYKSYRVRNVAAKLYGQLVENGIDVLFDDRDERAGVIFADMDLIGIPHLIIISERGIDANTFEYKNRRTGEKINIKMDDLLVELKLKLEAKK